MYIRLKILPLVFEFSKIIYVKDLALLSWLRKWKKKEEILRQRVINELSFHREDPEIYTCVMV